MTTGDASNVTLLQLGDAEPPRPGQEVYGRPSANRADHTQVRFWSTDVERDVAELSASGAVFEDYDFPALKTVDHIATTAGIGKSACTAMNTASRGTGHWWSGGYSGARRCSTTGAWSCRPQFSTTTPFKKRLKTIDRNSTRLPVAGTPRNSPSWVPWWRN